MGRIININNGCIYISDITGVLKLKLDNSNPVNEGDIVSIRVNRGNAKEITILTKAENNPISIADSPYNKLNKNDRKLVDILKNRQSFMKNIRDFFDKKDFLEINSPYLLESGGVEYYIEPFTTTYYDYSNNPQNLFLPTSPEFSLKEAISAGLEKIYEIKTCFRNCGENSLIHNPEFFMLEWYRAYDTYESVIDDTVKLISYLGKKCYKTDKIIFNDKECSINKFEKKSVKELFSNFGINLDYYRLDKDKFSNDLKKYFKSKNYEPSYYENLNKDDLFFKFFLEFIEPTLGFNSPTIVYDYPLEMSILSEPTDSSNMYGKRFELYICGIEIANGFGELTDWEIQEKNFNKVVEERKKYAKIELTFPTRFISSLKFGIPPTGGVALGVERLFMLFEGLKSIKNTNIF